MRFSAMAVVAAAAFAAQVGCTVGAPAMNDATGSSAIVEQVSVARRTSLPACTPARDDLHAYVRDEKLFATCDGADWRDDDGNALTTTTPDGTIEQL